MSTITAIILARNEEQHIADCIKSIQCANEILVIDDGSTDKTVELAEGLGAKVIPHPLNNDWSQQRIFGISQATSDWILFIDSDERISPELNDEIRKSIQSGVQKAYWLSRHNVFHNNAATHGSMRPDKVLRLMPKEGATVEGFVHETFISPFPQDTLKGKLYHYTYDNWTQYFNKFNKYTSAAAEKYYEQGKQSAFDKQPDVHVTPYQWITSDMVGDVHGDYRQFQTYSTEPSEYIRPIDNHAQDAEYWRSLSAWMMKFYANVQ